MTVSYLDEVVRIQSSTRKAAVVSLTVHVVLFLVLALIPKTASEALVLTEITWLAPGDPDVVAQGPSAAETTPAPELGLPRLAAQKSDENVQRNTPVAEIEPDPQSIQAVENRISERLASLQRAEATKPIDIASLAAPTQASRPKLAGAPTGTNSGRPGVLARDTGSSRGGGGSPITLKRGEPRVMKADAVSTPIPERLVERAAPRGGTETTRQLAGAEVTGPVADRAIISYVKPEYPEWAKREGVDGSVEIYFVVLPDGRVKENVVVERTSGFADFDQNAVNAILAWRFEPLKSGQSGEQWGTIVLHYRLSNTN